jgi:hypothetical protein
MSTRNTYKKNQIVAPRTKALARRSRMDAADCMVVSKKFVVRTP